MEIVKSKYAREEAVLQNVGLNCKTITGIKEIKNKKNIFVSRIFFEDGNTIIAKHIEWQKIFSATYLSIPPALQYESCNYQFLTSIVCPHSIKIPKLLALVPGLLILEDLEEDAFNFTTEREAQFALMDTLARLHTSSRTKELEYLSFKKQFGIPEKDKRKIPLADPEWCCQIAKKWILSMLVKDPIKNAKIMTELDVIENTLTHSEDFFAFTHNDIVSRRQSIVKNEEFYLIDFEVGKYDYALREIAKLYVGKVEIDFNNQIYQRNQAQLIPECILLYKEKWEEYNNRQISTLKWENNLKAAVVFQTLVLIGQLLTTQYRFHKQGISLKPKQHLANDLESISKVFNSLLKEECPVFQLALKMISEQCKEENSISLTINT